MPFNVRVSAVAAAILFTTAAFGAVFYVHPESTQNCIQDCLDACSDDDTVLVGADHDRLAVEHGGVAHGLEPRRGA